MKSYQSNENYEPVFPESNELTLSNLFCIVIDHYRCSIGIREKFSLSEQELTKFVQRASSFACSCFVLSTCNRTEFYFYLDQSENISSILKKVLDSICELKTLESDFILKHSLILKKEQALKHFFRVSSGIESMILGEGQILKQIKDSYQLSIKNSSLNSFLNQLIQRALSTGKRVRTKTAISKGAMSVSAASVQIAQSIFFNKKLKNKKIMILGNGEVSKLCLEQLSSQQVESRITLVSRKPKKSFVSLIKKLKIREENYQSFRANLTEQDLIFVCTKAPFFLLEENDFKINNDKKRQDPILVFDLSMPRNVSPKLKEKKELVRLMDLEDLKEEVYRSVERRNKQVIHVEKIISEEQEKFADWIKRTNQIKK